MSTIKPALTPEQYAIERAICSKAEAYAESVMCEGGSKRKRNYLTKDEAAHPDYAACDNAMRGRVEQFEILTEKPSRFGAYIGERVPNSSNHYVTTWTGDIVGTCYLGAGWRVHSYVGSRMYQATAWIAGKEFTGRTFGKGMCVSLRETDRKSVV